MKGVRIYGFSRGYGSYAQVTRGFMEAFSSHGYEPGAIDLFALEEPPDFDEEPSGLPLAKAAILTGPPIAAPRMTVNARHEQRYVMIAPNSNRLPEKTMAAVNQVATGLLVPSGWAATVLERYTALPVWVVPHGIDRAFGAEPKKADLEALHSRGEFRVLHLSSSEGERKGTLELCEGFTLAIKSGLIPETSVLVLVLVPQARARFLDWLDGVDPRVAKRFLIRDRLNIDGLPPELMVGEYQSVHLVCQPSRGEGFGLVPLEALSSGTPIAATRVTGHTEWYAQDLPGAVLVDTGVSTPIDDVPGAEAPSLLSSAVAAALGTAYSDWHALKAEALGARQRLLHKWSWPNQLEAFVRVVETRG